MELDFKKPKIMGILNVTPDSFSDGGQFLDPESAKKRLEKLIKDGADIVDLGGESTKPGAEPVSADVELSRVAPVIGYIFKNHLFNAASFSIDTYKSAVAQYALERGFRIVNDVTALRGDEKMIETIKSFNAHAVIMYNSMMDQKVSRREDCVDVMAGIKQFLGERIESLIVGGLNRNKIIIDPGMGAFVGQDAKPSFEIIKRLGELKDLNCPILVGPSRKLWKGKDLKTKDEQSVALSLEAIKNGASIVRIHNARLMRASL